MVLEHRITQIPIEVLEEGTGDPKRVTQTPVEVAEQGTGDPKRLTQIVIEVPYQQSLWRLTQGVVEAAEQVTGAPLLRRFTQIVIEVGITQPVQPFVDIPFLSTEEWSPAFLSVQSEGAPIAYQSYFGPHIQDDVLGRRGTYVRVIRK